MDFIIHHNYDDMSIDRGTELLGTTCVATELEHEGGNVDNRPERTKSMINHG